MPRRKPKAKVTTATEEAPISVPIRVAANDVPSSSPSSPASEPAMDAAASPPPVYAADPHPKITVSLSDYRGGPSAHLLRSHRYNQMQIRFDGEQPGEQAQAMLRDAGWRDRTEEEGIWTKQIARAARWQSVRLMEQEFRAVPTAIREAKGLAPALEGLAPA